MLDRINPVKTKTWARLAEHYLSMKNVHMRELFSTDPGRSGRFSVSFEDIFLDYSKNIITQETMRLLFDLAEEIKLEDSIKKMFSGDRINETENRAVLHTALRNRSGNPVYCSGKDVMPEVRAVLDKIESFSDKIILKEWKGYTGKPVTDIVNIGIGGSDLGPVMVSEALKHYRKPGITPHFVSNVVYFC